MKHPTEVVPDDVVRWRDWLRSRKKSFATVAFKLSVVRSFFEYLKAAGVDPCGERGEFHTFVFAGPSFKDEVRLTVGERVFRDSFWFCDLVPEG